MHQLGKNKWKFTASMVQDAPDTRGIFALWENDTVVCIGRADGGAQTIRSCLMEHLLGEPARQSQHVTHYSWEICADPASREAEVLGHARPEARAGVATVLQLDPQRRSA